MDALSSGFLLKIALLAYAAGIVGSLSALGREKAANCIGFGSAILGGLCGIGAAVLGLASGTAGTAAFEVWPSAVPYVKFSVKLDALGAFFVLIVSLLSVAVSIYSLGYARGFYGRKQVGVLGALYNVLLLAITLVFSSADAFCFLVAWEIMALAAYCLVSFEHEKS